MGESNCTTATIQTDDCIILIVGAGRVGHELAKRLHNRNEHVVVIEADEVRAESLRCDEWTVRHGDGTDSQELREAGIEDARTVVAATGDDDTNLLVAQLANSKFDVDVIARVNTPTNVDAFEELEIRVISSDCATAWSMDNVIERPSLSNWTTDLDEGEAVQEIELTVGDVVSPIAHFRGSMLRGCLGHNGQFASASGPPSETASSPWRRRRDRRRRRQGHEHGATGCENEECAQHGRSKASVGPHRYRARTFAQVPEAVCG